MTSVLPPVVWITGLSGAGKSTLAAALAKRLRQAGEKVVHLDGDGVRAIVGDNIGHAPDERLANAYRIARFCAFLQQQDVMVVCSTMSLFPEVWAWNRRHLDPYTEVYLRVSIDELRSRDQRNLYSGAASGEVTNVVGVDVHFSEPVQAHITLTNETEGDLHANLEILVAHLAKGRS